MSQLQANRRHFTSAAILLGWALTTTACGHQEPSAERRIDTPTKTTVASVVPGASQAAATAPVAGAVAVSETPKPAPIAATPVARAQASASTKPAIKRLVIASDVQEREPVGLDAATVEQPVVAFLEFQNPGSSEYDVIVTFQHESGEQVGFIELNVPAEKARFRTWGRTKNIKRPGNWTAIVKSDDGEELARQSFTVSSPSTES